MRRSLLTILIVACLAAFIARSEQAIGLGARHPQWVRTVDGWERRGAVDARRVAPWPIVHPALVALFQLGVSAFALIAFPTEARVLAGEAAVEEVLSRRSVKLRMRRPKLAKRRAVASR